MHGATYLPRVETVVSFQQLEADSTAVEKAALKSSQDASVCPVSSCAGKTVPLFSYAVKAPPKSSIQRIASTASFGMVPDMDSVRCVFRFSSKNMI